MKEAVDSWIWIWIRSSHTPRLTNKNSFIIRTRKIITVSKIISKLINHHRLYCHLFLHKTHTVSHKWQRKSGGKQSRSSSAEFAAISEAKMLTLSVDKITRVWPSTKVGLEAFRQPKNLTIFCTHENSFYSSASWFILVWFD